MASIVNRDLSVDTTNDIVVSGGDLVLTTDIDAVAQDLRAQLQFVAGEWFLTPEQGVPLYSQVLIKNPNMNVVRGAFRKAILGVLGVTGLVSMTLTFVGANRQLQITFIVQTVVGIIDQTVLLGS